MKDDVRRNKVALVCDGFTERAPNGPRVLVESSIETPHDRDVGDVLAKWGRKVSAMVVQFGNESGLGAACARSLACGEQIASLRAQQVACGAPESKRPERQAGQATGSAGPAQPKRSRTESGYSSLSSVGR